ncbi:MAG: hypothetical protein JWL94_1642 [Microbacteriaceae bacterium]|jgi:hypothetical protein|nr:hypothetical protein [Microbacteriaceae bacterium]
MTKAGTASTTSTGMSTAKSTTGRAAISARCTPNASTTPITIGIHWFELKNWSGSVTATVSAVAPEPRSPGAEREPTRGRSHDGLNPVVMLTDKWRPG